MDIYNEFSRKCVEEIAAGNDISPSAITFQIKSLLASQIYYSCKEFVDNYNGGNISDEDIQLLCIGGAEDTIKRFINTPGFSEVDKVLNFVGHQILYYKPKEDEEKSN